MIDILETDIFYDHLPRHIDHTKLRRGRIIKVIELLWNYYC